MDLTLQTPSVWTTCSDQEREAIFSLGESYKTFLDQSKTERECAKTILSMAEAADFRPIVDFLGGEEKLLPGTRLMLNHKNKAVLLMVIGEKPLTAGLNIVGSHIDAPRLDLKPRPLYEAGELALLKTHYYGGVKKYQWTCMPLALHGLAYTESGEEVEIHIGDEKDDPVLYITDLLPHLSKDQNDKKMSEGITGEQLNAIIGHIPEKSEDDAEPIKNPVKQAILKLIHEKYGLKEADFLLAEIELVPAQNAQDVGLDRSLILGHGHDDRSCAYASLAAILETKIPEHTAVALFVDKEEIGSTGNTSMNARFFENVLAELLSLEGSDSELLLRRVFAQSRVLSADVCGAFDPSWPEVMDEKNTYFLGKGVALEKYGGARGKSRSNDANAEFLQEIRTLFAQHDIIWQIGELGKIDQGGGGTIAHILAERGAEVVDCGVPMLAMHAPLELISKADLYMTMKAYRAFFI